MIIDNFDLLRVTATPNKANPPLIIDANTVLTGTIAFKGFKPVAWRRMQITQGSRPVQVLQLPPGRVLNIWWQFSGALAQKYSLRLGALESGDHRTILPYDDNMSRLDAEFFEIEPHKD